MTTISSIASGYHAQTQVKAKFFFETPRVTNPVRQSQASSREAGLAVWTGDRHCEA